MWPGDVPSLEALQHRLAALEPSIEVGIGIGGCFVCFGRGSSGAGEAGDRGWAAAVVRGEETAVTTIITGCAGGPYVPGCLALREGPLLASAVASLPAPPGVLLVNATGRDHPRRAGLALHLGWALGVPTVGVTHRPLLARGDPPGPDPGAAAPLNIEGRVVGAWLRVREGVRPIAVHAAWGTSVGDALEIVRSLPPRARTPAPLRTARCLARRARAEDVP